MMEWKNLSKGDRVKIIPSRKSNDPYVDGVIFCNSSSKSIFQVISNAGLCTVREEDFKKGFVKPYKHPFKQVLKWKDIKVGYQVEFEQRFYPSGWVTISSVGPGSDYKTKAVRYCTGIVKDISAYGVKIEYKYLDFLCYKIFNIEEFTKGFIRAFEPDTVPNTCFFCGQLTETIKVSDFILYNSCKNPDCETQGLREI